jgi:hypothetical protein
MSNHVLDLPPSPIAGFEASGYAWRGTELVWLGKDGLSGAEHPRNLLRTWRPDARRPAPDAARLRAGAALALAQLGRTVAEASTLAQRPGVLPWLLGQPLAFPLNLAAPRLQALRNALERDDVEAFERAALGVLGLGPGLTPSGDDLLGGIFFALAHAPRQRWAPQLPQVQTRLRDAANAGATNAISATLLADLMQGIGYRALHELLEALHGGSADEVERAIAQLAAIGASSGTDLLTGVLLALTALPATTSRNP